MGNTESSQNSDVYTYHEDILRQGAEAVITGSDDDSNDEEMQEGPSQSNQNESDDTNGSSNEDVAVNDTPSSENNLETSTDPTPSSTESSPVHLQIPERESSSLVNQNEAKEDRAAFITPPSSRDNSPVPRRSRRFPQNVSKGESATKQRLSMRDSDDSEEEMLVAEPEEESVAVVTRSKTSTLKTNVGSSEGQPEKISEATTSSNKKQLDNKSTIKSRKRSITDTPSDSSNKPTVKTTGGFDRPFVTAERGIHMTKKNAVHLQKVIQRPSSNLEQVPISTGVTPSSSASHDSVTGVSSNPNDNKKEKIRNHKTSQDRHVNENLAESEAKVSGSTDKSKDNKKVKKGATPLNVLESAAAATEETTVHRTSQVKDDHKSLVEGSVEKSVSETAMKRSSSNLEQVPMSTGVTPSSSASHDSVTGASSNPNDNKREKIRNHKTSQDRHVNENLAESEAKVNGSTDKSKDNKKVKKGATPLNVLESATATEETTVHRTSQVKGDHKSLVEGSVEKSVSETAMKRIKSTELTSSPDKSPDPLSITQNKKELSKILVKKSVDRSSQRPSGTPPIDKKSSGARPVNSPSSSVDRPATTGALISPVAERENKLLKKPGLQSSYTEINTSQNNNVTEEPMDISSSASGTDPSQNPPDSVDKNRKSIKNSSNISGEIEHALEISLKKAKKSLGDASASRPTLRVPLIPSTGVASPVQVVPGASMDLPKIPTDPQFAALPSFQQTATTPSGAANPAQPMTSRPDHCIFTLLESFNMSVTLGDITEQCTEAIVNTTDGQLAHVGAVSRHIAAAAGQQMINECQDFLRRQGPLNTMDVMDTCAGGRFNRRVKKILHVVPSMGSYGADKAVVDKLIHTYLQCLKYADRKVDCSSISFPLLGAGSYLPDTSMNAFYNAVLIFLSDRGTNSKLNDVRLILNDDELHHFAVDYYSSCYENILTNGIESAIGDAVNSFYGNNTWETKQKLLNQFASWNNGGSGGGSSSSGDNSSQNLFRGSAVKRPKL